MSAARSKPQGPRGSRPPPSQSTPHSGTSSPSSTNPLSQTRISIPSPLSQTAYHAPSLLQAQLGSSQTGSLYPSIPPPLSAPTPQPSSRSVTPTPRRIALPPLVTGSVFAVGAIGRADPTEEDYNATEGSGPPSLPLLTSLGGLYLNFGGGSTPSSSDQSPQSIRPTPIGGRRSRPKPMLGLDIVGGSAAVGGIGANDPDAVDETNVAGAADDVDGGGITIRPNNPQPAGVEPSLEDLTKVLTPRSATSQASTVPMSPPNADATPSDEGDWTEAEKYLIDVERLGEGAGGEVFKVRDRRTNKILARKVIQARSTPPKQLVRELNALSTTKNENIIRFYGAYLSPSSSEVKVIMELCEGGSLEAISERINGLGNRASEKVVGKIAEGIFHGLAYLHAKRIIHRDIKPSNILLSRAGVVKLCDFGVSGELVDSIAGTWTGTSLYMAPERIAGGLYTIRSDVWSSGLTLLTFAQGRFPYPDDLDGIIELVSFLQRTEPPQLVDEEPREDGTGGVRWSGAMKDFIAVCLTKDGQTRPTPRECLLQPWIVESSKHKVNMPQWIRDVWGWDTARGRTQLNVAGADGNRQPSVVRENSAVRVGTSDQGA